MASEIELLRLAVAAYEAAAEPELWPAFLKRCAEIASADAAFLQVHDLAERTSIILGGFGIGSPLKESYNRYYAKLNLWRERGRALYVRGNVLLDQEQCPRQDLERSEFYNDCLKPSGLAYSSAVVLAREGNRTATLTSLRGPGKRPFGETTRDIYRFLSPHLVRAWTIREHLEILGASEAMLDRIHLGVVFIGAEGTAIYWNRPAEKLFQANDGLTLRGGAFCAADRRAEIRIRRAIQNALSPSRPPGPAAIAVPRPSSRGDYQLVAAPLLSRPSLFVGMPSPRALVLLADPESREPVNADLLIQLYKLTPKEAALAVKLAQGLSVEQAAKELSVTYETARTHLRRIFSKTGTSRQAELLLLMVRLPGLHAGGVDG